METSQQQRRSTVGQFAKTLADADLEFDAIDLVDMLWLAQFMEPVESVLPPAESENKTPEREPDVITSDVTADEPELGLYSETSSVPSTTTETDTEVEEQLKGTPFSVPAAPAIRTLMELAKALRPLMRKVPSRTRFDLDEDATVTQIAETEVWMPVVCPTPERWLELDLVVESAKTTVIWERAISELNHLAEYQGAFRTVRTWRLSAMDNQVQLFPRWRDFSTQATNARPHTPRELIDPAGRRLIWLVTDCTSSLWRQGVIHPALQQWAAVQPVAIVQMFPELLWKRTALRDGHQVKLSALAPGLPSDRLQVEGLPLHLERQGRPDLVTVPIITLDSISICRWARVVAGSGDSWSPGRTFDLAFIARQASKARSNAPSRSIAQKTAQERVDFFRATTASDTVKHLANLMAATPVSLPVIDLLRAAFRSDFKEEVRQSDVAEVLLSGLLRRCDTEEDVVCRYEFWGDDSSNPDERVRDILLGDASISKTLEVLNVLSASICKKIGSPVKSFQALLIELESTDREDLRAAALPFARVGISVLRRLGGVHANVTWKYDLDSQINEVVDESDLYLKGLAAEATRHLPRSIQRRRAVNRLLQGIRQSGELFCGDRYAYPPELYDEALQNTLLYVVNKIDMYDPTRAKMMTWVNRKLDFAFKAEVKAFMRERAKKAQETSFSRLLSEDYYFSSESPTYLSDQVRQIIERDPEGLFKAKHLREQPEINFQVIALYLIDHSNIRKLAENLNVNEHRLYSFFRRACVQMRPHIQRYLEDSLKT